MPYPNEHAARLRDPSKIAAGTFRRVAGGKLFGRIDVPETIYVIWGKLETADKPTDHPIAQALRFPTKDWTEARAREWLDDKGIKVLNFEPASGAAQSEGEANANVALDLLSGPDGVTIEAAGGGEKLPRLEIVAYTGCEVRLKGWPRPVVVDLAGIEMPAKFPILADHDPTQPIGHGGGVIAGGELRVRGMVSVDSDKSEALKTSAQRGFPWQASIGIQAVSQELYRSGETFVANGRRFTAGDLGICLVTKSRLREVSVLSIGADEDSAVNIAARGRGLESDMLTAEEIRAGERERLDRIEAVCSGIRGPVADELKAKAIGEKISFEELQSGLLKDAKRQAELEQVYASRPAIGASHTDPGAGAAGARVIQAAAVMTAIGEEKAVERFEAPVLEAAQKMRGLGLQELIVTAAALEGVSLPRFRNEPHQWLRAAFSTISVPGIVSAVATDVLLASFDSVEQTWRSIAKRSSVKDFKTSSRYRLTGEMKYELVAKDGELKHATLGEESWDVKADTYGKIIVITRQDIINDDLGAFAEIPSALGRGAGLSLNEIFWTAFMDNATFFTTARNNYAVGAGTALDIDALTAAELMFLDQVDADGHPLGLPPKTLLTPTDLNATAAQLMKSLELREPGSSTKVPVVNPHAGKFTPVSSTYLKNSKFTGHSTKAWYLLADANVLPVIEVVFLNGREAPTVDTADADFNTLGVQMRGYHDFGISRADWRGGVKMKGEA